MAKKIKIIKSGKLDKSGLKSIGKGAVIATGGALLTYSTETLTNIDFGEYTPVVVAIGGIVLNFFRKLLTNYQSK